MYTSCDTVILFVLNIWIKLRKKETDFAAEPITVIFQQLCVSVCLCECSGSPLIFHVFSEHSAEGSYVIKRTLTQSEGDPVNNEEWMEPQKGSDVICGVMKLCSRKSEKRRDSSHCWMILSVAEKTGESKEREK